MSKTIYINPTQSINSVLASLKEKLTASAETSEEILLILAPGIYREKITIDIPNLTMQGDSCTNTILSFGDYGKFIMPDGIKRGTFRSYTLFVDAPHVTLQNLTVENTSAPRSEVGQAIALYVDGDDFHASSCRFLGNQDTLFTAPLPEKEYEPGGFRGPKEFAPRTPTTQYYDSCYICGDIDFIFGSATALFHNCIIHSLNNGPLASSDGDTLQTYGYITAASTPAGQPYGYVFYRCHFTSDCPENSVYLGRPWRDNASMVLIECKLENHIRKEGFHDWGKSAAHQTVTYIEIDCSGAGSDLSARASFSKAGTAEEKSFYLQPFSCFSSSI